MMSCSLEWQFDKVQGLKPETWNTNQGKADLVEGKHETKNNNRKN